MEQKLRIGQADMINKTEEQDITPQTTDIKTIFTEYYDLYSNQLYRYFYYKTNNRHTSEDLLAETFGRAMQRYGSYNTQKGAPDVWLFMIAKNLLSDYMKRGKKAQTVQISEIMPDDSALPEAAALQTETRAQLFSALKKLPEKDQTLIILKYASNLKNKKIASVTGKSERHVAVALGRAIEKLRILMNDEGD